MSEQSELDELAQRYLDLWQDQMTALAADPEFAENLQRLVASMGLDATSAPAAFAAWPGIMTGISPAAQQGQAGEGKSQNNGPNAKNTARESRAQSKTPPGAAAPTPASGHGGPDLDVFAQRLAALEGRIATLEAAASGTGGKTARRSGKGRS